MENEPIIINNTPDTAMSVLSLFNTSKEGIERFSNQIIEAVTNGNVDALRVKAYLKTLQEIAERIDKGTKYEQAMEASKYPENKPFMIAGCEMVHTSVHTAYEFAACNDSQWDELQVLKNGIKDKIEAREKFLKAIKERTSIVDEETGAVIRLNPPLKKQTIGVKVSIKSEQYD